MQITRETDYAIRCMLYIAASESGSAVVGDISEAQSVPRTFAAKIMQKLQRAGLVKSKRGVKGGYFLTREPSEISLLDIIEAIEGPLSLNICVVDKNSCDRVSQCSVHPIWVELRDIFAESLKRYTLKDLINLNTP